MDKRLEGLLGLATRARKVAIGQVAMEAIQAKSAYLVLLAADCSELTQSKVEQKCSGKQIPLYKIEKGQEMAWAIGKSMVSYVAILDAGFAKSMMTYLK